MRIYGMFRFPPNHYQPLQDSPFGNLLFLVDFRPRITQGNRSIKNKLLVIGIRIQTKIPLPLKLKPTASDGMF